MREEIIKVVNETKIIAIVRGVYGDDALNLARALYAGGVRLLEVTFDQKNRDNWAKTVDAISTISREMAGKLYVGAGTVTSLELLKIAKKAGATFIVSPDTNGKVIKATVKNDMVSMPGAMTPTEILAAYNFGADFVKVFPTSNLGASYIKAVRGPLNHIPMLAVGGVNEKNVGEFIAAGCSGAGVGGALTNKDIIASGEFDKITALAKELIKNSK